jgi:hypothetical protein
MLRDAINLSKLVRHSDPVLFRRVVTIRFGAVVPEPPKDQLTPATRRQFLECLHFMSPELRKEIDEWAEPIKLLADVEGQDAVECMRLTGFDEEQRAILDGMENQYDRSLWLCCDMPGIFRDALDLRYAAILRRSASFCSRYHVPGGLPFVDSAEAHATFHEAIAEHLKSAKKHIAVEVFECDQGQGGARSTRFHVSVHFNQSPESAEWVNNSKLENLHFTRAASMFVAYNPSEKTIEVLSKTKEGRNDILDIFASTMVQSQGSISAVPQQVYDYQCLARPFSFDLGDEPVSWAKITKLGFDKSGRRLSFQIDKLDEKCIHVAASDEIDPEFKFEHHTLTHGQITVQFHKRGKGRVPVGQIILTGITGCQIKTTRERDRHVCERLLKHWGITRDMSNETLSA